MTGVPPRHWWTVAIAAAITSLTVIAVAGISSSAASAAKDPASAASGAVSSASRIGVTPIVVQKVVTDAEFQSSIDNVVFILADDLDWAAFRQVPRLNALQSKATTFMNATVTDSLCCPSRVSILRSQYVHNHLVVSNRASSGGGWPMFASRGEEDNCLPTWLHAAGVQTAFMGKYLNDYPLGASSPRYVPPGWDRWVVPVTQSAMYRGYGYTLNSNGSLKSYGDKPRDFLGDVLIKNATDFLDTATEPFYLQLNLTSPHRPSPIAARNAARDKAASVPRSASYNATGLNEPAWRSSLPVMGAKRLASLDRKWRERVQSAETVADAYDAVVASLRASGKLDRTLIVVGSDNGYHSAVRRLPPGKRTPYSEDTVVPFLFIGPGVPADAKIGSMTSTIDLAPTFAALLDAKSPSWIDGRSLVPFLARGPVENWRTGVISESLGQAEPGDPDYETFKPPQFTALRTEHWLYVEYVDGTRELFDRFTDPEEMDNIMPSADPVLVKELSAQLLALSSCAGETCRVADSLPN